MNRKILIEVTEEEFQKIKNGALETEAVGVDTFSTKELLDDLIRRFGTQETIENYDAMSRRQTIITKTYGTAERGIINFDLTIRRVL